MIKCGFLLILLTLIFAPLSESSVEATQTPPATPSRCLSPEAAAAADAMAAKFDDHQLVFIGSTHGDAKIEEFLMCLVSRPAFKQRVTDIVVEWASSGHQRLLDRYLLTLDEVAANVLEPIWFDTDHPTLWATMPQVRQFVAGSVQLSATQQRELDRRSSIMSDPQRTMRARYQGRDHWFLAHPDDVPPRP